MTFQPNIKSLQNLLTTPSSCCIRVTNIQYSIKQFPRGLFSVEWQTRWDINAIQSGGKTTSCSFTSRIATGVAKVSCIESQQGLGVFQVTYRSCRRELRAPTRRNEEAREVWRQDRSIDPWNNKTIICSRRSSAR